MLIMSFLWKIVLANSSIIYATSHQNVDLFLALKGGGANFGNPLTYLEPPLSPLLILGLRHRYTFYDHHLSSHSGTVQSHRL